MQQRISLKYLIVLNSGNDIELLIIRLFGPYKQTGVLYLCGVTNILSN